MSEPNRVPNLSTVGNLSPPETNPHSPATDLWLAGPSPAITQLRAQIRRVAPYFRTALLIGERGCGGEAAAHTLYQFSPLSHRPFVNLTSAEANLLFAESHESADLMGTGMFYIPRPERLSRIAQTGLLRLIRRRGPKAPRIVAFAERGLRPLVSASGFSADLAERLGSLRIAIPPLRDRREDIPQLLDHMLQTIAAQSGITPPQLAPDLVDAARKTPWHGNLTQLYSAAEGLMERATHLILHASDLEAVLGAMAQPSARDHREIRMLRLDDVIQEHIRAVLVACNGNKLRTAEVLGISRSTLYRMLDAPAQPPAPSLDFTDLQMTG
jgi:DNA-binding NtrC family response regulator